MDAEALAHLSLVDRLAPLPLAEQLAQIARWLDEGASPAALLLAAASLIDHEPCAWLLERLTAQGQLASPVIEAPLTRLLSTSADTFVQRLLSSLRAPLREGSCGEQARVVERAVIAALDASPISRIIAICLLERWLTVAAPSASQRRRDEAVRRCSDAIMGGLTSELSSRLLLDLPGAQLPRLQALAAQHDVAERWQAMLRAMASEVLGALADVPRTLSQANAEQLLAREVYEAPGHFLAELIQNADDAGAREVRIEIDASEVRFCHDGAPFDARDVVGVLSIGLGTKRRGQIGRFGVGFKSVHQVTDRPQVYSGPFAFEIMRVSLPRALSSPSGRAPSVTTLVLPLREGVRVEMLVRLAAEIPASTLLALRHVRTLQVTAPGLVRVASVAETAPGQVSLSQSGERASMLLVEREAEGVMVAVALDEEGLAAPLLAGEPSVYCFLPTAEATGLRFMIHAPFEVPLDRERIERDSASNQALLARAGELLASLVHRAVSTGASTRETRALLAILPLPEELSHLAYRAVCDGLARRGHALAMLPTAAGGVASPSRLSVAFDPALCEALARVSLDAQGTTLLAPLDPREVRVARWLGASSFTPDVLVAWLSRSLAQAQPGDPCSVPWLPRAALCIAEALGKVPSDSFDAALLACLPWLVDQRGQLTAPAALRLADGALRRLYGALAPMLDEAAERALAPNAERLLRSLGARPITPDELLSDLREPVFAQRVLATHGDSLLVAFLATLSPSQRRLASALPVFRDDASELRALSGSAHLWLAPDGALGAWLRALGSPRPALVSAELVASHRVDLLALGAQIFSIDELLSSLVSQRIAPSVTEARSLLGLLDAERDELAPRQRQALGRAQVFPDAGGQRRSLWGEGSVAVADEPAIEALFVEVPWLDAQVVRLPLVQAMAPRRVGVMDVARALLNESAPPLVLSPEARREALSLLARSPERLDGALRERLRRAPLFPSSQGLVSADALRLAPVDARLVRLYAGSPDVRPLLDDVALLEAARSLGAEVAPVDVRDLIGDLQATLLLVEGDARLDDLAALLIEAAHQLSPSQLEPLLSLSLFGVHGGGRDSIGRWGSSEPGCRRAQGVFLDALAGGPFPLLSERDEVRFGPLLSALGVRSASLDDLLTALDSSWGSLPSSRDRIRAALVALRDTLPRSPGLSARIEALPLFRTRTGALCEATRAVLPSELTALAASAGVSLPWLSSVVEARLLDAQSASDAAQLSGALRFALVAEVITQSITEQLTEGAQLDAQPVFARSAEQLVDLARVLRSSLDLSTRLALPLGVLASGALARGVLFKVSGDELLLCRALSLTERIAEPGWATLASADEPERLSLLPAFRLAEAALAASRGKEPTALTQPEVRTRLYAFVLARAEEFAREARAWGPLGQARFVAATGGQLLSPRQLLLDDALPELPLEGRPLAEVPGELRALFARVYGLEEAGRRRLAQALVELLDSHSQRDGARSMQLLGLLARTLGVAASSERSRESEVFAQSVARSLKLAKHVRIETSRGYLRPRELRLLDETSLALVARFHPDPPAVVTTHPGLDEVAPLLRMLGAVDDLSAEELGPFLSGAAPLRASPDARLALAIYVALAAVRRPELRQHLALDKAAWVPSAAGSWRTPASLFWPEPELDLLLGEAPSLFPHPELALSAPERLGSWLPFRHLDDVTPELVAEGLPSDAPASQQVLQWLERGLAQGRLVAAEVRRSLAEKLLLVDDAGRLAPASRLRPAGDAQEGDLRAVWPDSPSFPRLCAALRLGERPSLPRPASVLALTEAPNPRRKPSTPSKAPPSAPAPAEEHDGLAARLKRWWSAKSEPATTAPPSQQPARTPMPARELPARQTPSTRRQVEQRAWFAGERSLGAQLDSGVSFDETRAERAEYGFAASPSKLPVPYVYAPRDVFGRFDMATQRWLPVSLPPQLSAPGEDALARVRLSGRLPAGTAHLPIPLYASLSSCEAGQARAFAARDGSMKLVLDEASEVRIELWLREAPRFSDDPVDLPVDEALLSLSVVDAELPAEVLSFVDGLNASALSPLARSLRVRDFIRERYRYEPSYLEDPSVGRALSRIVRGRSNEHLAALHAARDGKHLGAGVCYELNTLACELLRRAGVPAVVCAGWLFDGGQVTAPDHLWAMALVGSHWGPRMIPIDAASTVDGRPIRARQRPDGPFKPERASPASLPPEPAWALRQPTRDSAARKLSPTIELSRVVRFLEQSAGERPLDEGTLRRRLRVMLDDPEQATQLLSLLRGD